MVIVYGGMKFVCDFDKNNFNVGVNICMAWVIEIGDKEVDIVLEYR